MSLLTPGTVLANRFEIDRQAGSGGMGAVYRARDRFSGDIVAVKLLHGDSGSPERGERFTREALLLAELRHPRIVSYIAHGQAPDGQRFLAMEWLEGEDLGQRLRRGTLTLNSALLLIQHVADALSIAHQHGIVHRDIKPSNLYLPGGEIDRVKILDFGIARRAAASQALTRTGIAIGTPQYMAPEQARGGRKITPAADIFSLGCVLYECLAGQPPFTSQKLAAVLIRILYEDPPSIVERRPGIPDVVVALLQRMLVKDPTQRIPDAAALIEELLRAGEAMQMAFAPTSATPSLAPSSFAASEQGLFSLVIASPSTGPADSQGGSHELEPIEDVSEGASMQTLLRGRGLRAEFLLDGSLVVTLRQTWNATDQAVMAARTALLIKERWPDADVAMATGLGSQKGTITVGEVAERAARLLRSNISQVNPANSGSFSSPGVWIDPLSARLLEARFVLSSVGGHTMLTSEARDVDASRRLLGKPTPCLGREADLTHLETHLDSCIEEEESRGLLITAPPGVGKSRLRHEFMLRVAQRAEPVTVLYGCGDVMTAGQPYAIMAQALRMLCGLQSEGPLDEQRARLTEYLEGKNSLPEQDRVRMFLGELVGVPYTEEGNSILFAAREDPRIMRDRVRQAFLDWLKAECQAAPVLLVLDDLQWTDALSLGLFNDALRELQEARLFVLAFARPEVFETFPLLWKIHRLQVGRLKELSRKVCERLVLHVLGKQKLTSELLEQIVNQSAGNALYLEELIRAVAEGDQDQQPETVLAMLQARIGKFETGMRRTLRAASIFGQTFWEGGISAVLDMNRGSSEVETWLSALVDAEVIVARSKSRLRDEKEYEFRQVLMREAVCGLLTESDLVMGHKRAAAFLSEAGERDAAIIADHFAQGLEPEQAAEYYCRAAEQAYERFDRDGALRMVERGVVAGAVGETLGRLRSVEAATCLWGDQFDGCFPAAMAALPLLRQGGVSFFHALNAATAAAVQGMPQWRAQLPQLIDMLVHVEPEVEARAVCAQALGTLLAMLPFAMPRAQLEPVWNQLVKVVEATRDPLVQRWLFVARCMSARHLLPTPFLLLRDAEEGTRLGRQAGDLKALIPLQIYADAMTRFELGDPRAEKLLREHLQRFEQSGDALAQLACKQQLSHILSHSDDAAALAEAEKLARDYIANPAGWPIHVAQAHDNLARVKLARKEPAVIDAETACRLLEPSPNFLPTAHATLIRAHLMHDNTAAAVQVAQHALTIIEQFSCIGYAEVELRLWISEAFLAHKDLERARLELRETVRQIRLRETDITDADLRVTYLQQAPQARALKLTESLL